MRISKEPEVRKQEILDMAMKVFARKGYEATTMKDIAKEAQVVPGLCYHYFQNKQELYQTAMTQYAKKCSSAFTAVFQQQDLKLEQCLDMIEKIAVDQETEYSYKDFFDKEGNELFHQQLTQCMSKEIFPVMKKYLQCLADRGEIQCSDTEMMAHFVWAAQLEVILMEEIPMEDRMTFIRKMVNKLLK